MANLLPSLHILHKSTNSGQVAHIQGTTHLIITNLDFISVHRCVGHQYSSVLYTFRLVYTDLLV